MFVITWCVVLLCVIDSISHREVCASVSVPVHKRLCCFELGSIRKSDGKNAVLPERHWGMTAEWWSREKSERSNLAKHAPRVLKWISRYIYTETPCIRDECFPACRDALLRANVLFSEQSEHDGHWLVSSMKGGKKTAALAMLCGPVLPVWFGSKPRDFALAEARSRGEKTSCVPSPTHTFFIRVYHTEIRHSLFSKVVSVQVSHDRTYIHFIPFSMMQQRK